MRRRSQNILASQAKAAEEAAAAEAPPQMGNRTADMRGAPGGGGGGKGSVAMKLMQSMGWSEGEGLGRERQGIATPIILQKTDKRAGVIVAAEPLPKTPTVRSCRTRPVLLSAAQLNSG